MMTCREVAQLLSRSLDEPLSWREKFGLHIHLRLCGACASYERTIVRFHGFLREGIRRFEEVEALVEERLSPEDRDRMFRLVCEALEAPGA